MSTIHLERSAQRDLRDKAVINVYQKVHYETVTDAFVDCNTGQVIDLKAVKRFNSDEFKLFEIVGFLQEFCVGEIPGVGEEKVGTLPNAPLTAIGVGDIGGVSDCDELRFDGEEHDAQRHSALAAVWSEILTLHGDWDIEGGALRLERQDGLHSKFE